MCFSKLRIISCWPVFFPLFLDFRTAFLTQSFANFGRGLAFFWPFRAFLPARPAWNESLPAAHGENSRSLQEDNRLLTWSRPARLPGAARDRGSWDQVACWGGRSHRSRGVQCFGRHEARLKEAVSYRGRGPVKFQGCGTLHASEELGVE